MTPSRATPLLSLLLASGCLHTPGGTCHRLPVESLCTRKLAEMDCAQAKIYCDLELEFAPQYADMWNNKGLIAERCLKDTKEAREDFLKAIHFDPKHASAYTNLGALSLQEGDYPKAEALLLRALEVDPDSVEARDNLRLALEQQKALVDAAPRKAPAPVSPRGNDKAFSQ